MMEDTEVLDLDSVWLESLYLQTDCNELDCPPPLFELPPPPRPPWLEDLETCEESSASESCDNILIIDSQVHLQETFQNLIIIAVCAAILVILLVFLVACIWRSRHFRFNNCHCGNKQESSGQNLELSETTLSSNNMMSYKEVYDNPNYSHIMIGGQPFFILPSGELSEHVPVPVSGETLTPRTVSSQHHIYEPGSSTYRSTSDYDTDSSTYRPDSDRSMGFCQPIYEEIDKEAETRVQGGIPFNTVAVLHNMGEMSGTVSQRLDRSPQPWSSKQLSRRQNPAKPNLHSSIYYYSDTLRKKSERDLTESDSGISSESTPSHVLHHQERNRKKKCDPSDALPLSHSNQTNSQNLSNLVQTQVFLTNLKSKEKNKVVKL